VSACRRAGAISPLNTVRSRQDLQRALLAFIDNNKSQRSAEGVCRKVDVAAREYAEIESEHLSCVGAKLIELCV
jgi:hypothetical protein